jgi:hypothetical protein
MATRHELVELLSGVDFAIPALPATDLPLEPVAYFASGCQRGEVTGFADIGHDVGVVADRCNEHVVRELLDLAGTDVQVFCDSGAFSEVTKSYPFEVKQAMTDADWQRVLGLYKRLGAVLGDQFSVVAPDRVGDQEVTLERLRRYAGELRAIDEFGVRILIPVQRGALSQADFYRQACDIVGFEMIPALPCKKAATSPGEAREFVKEVKPMNLHLLGLGVRNRKVAAYLQGIKDELGDCLVTMDSCVIAAHAAKTGGPGNGPRRLAVARCLVASLVDAGRIAAGVATRKRAGILLAFGQDLLNVRGTQLRMFAREKRRR